MTQEQFALDISNSLKDISAIVNNPWWDKISFQPKIKKVIFNNPATIVYWSDNTKTVVKCQEGDTYSKEVGLALCIAKKYLGNKSNFNNEFKKWIPEKKEELPSIEEMRTYIKNYCDKMPFCEKCIIYRLPQHKAYHCYWKSSTSDEEIIKNYKAIKEQELKNGTTRSYKTN